MTDNAAQHCVEREEREAEKERRSRDGEAGVEGGRGLKTGTATHHVSLWPGLLPHQLSACVPHLVFTYVTGYAFSKSLPIKSIF